MKPKWYSTIFLNFFAICSQFSITHLVGTKRNETIIYIFSLSRPFPSNFCLKRTQNCFFPIFRIFFAIFYEFSITRRIGTKRNDNFYFPCFSIYFNLLWLEMKPKWYFLNFFAIFLEFSITCRAGTEQINNFYFLSFWAFLNLFFASNEAKMVFYNFFEFFCYLFGIFYYAIGKNEMKR